MALTVGWTVISTIGSLIVFLVVIMYALNHQWPRPAVWATALIPVLGLQLPAWAMRLVPCVCPKCGGKARLGVAATSLSLIPTPTWAWSCTACDWSTYYWSPYQERWRNAQAQKSRRFYRRVFSFAWLRKRGH